MVTVNIPLILFTYTAGLSVAWGMIYTIRRLGIVSDIPRLYFIACLFDLPWCFGYLAMYLTGDPDKAEFAYRAGAAGWTLNMASVSLLSLSLLETVSGRKISPVPGYILVITSLFFFTAALSGRIYATSFTRVPGGWWEEHVPTGSLLVRGYIMWALITVASGVALLTLMIWKAKLRRHRHLIIYLFTPLGISAIFTMLINLLLPFYGIKCPPVGHILISFYLASTGYSIVKFRVIKPEPENITVPLLFQISDMVILTDSSGNILRVNHAVSALLGYGPEELNSKHAGLVLPGISALQEGAGEREAVTARGERIQVQCTVNPIDDIHGDRIGFFILLKDLTRVKRLEEMTRNLQISNRELERLSITDSLTGMYNRSKMENVLSSEVQRSRRYGSHFSIILYDIDNFKNINDTCGHGTGDEVLRYVADTVRRITRETDIAGRWGGDEFLIICVNTGREAAGILAEKIRVDLEKCRHPGIGSVTSSFGVTEYTENDTPESIITRGDNAMYDSKRRARNMVTVV